MQRRPPAVRLGANKPAGRAVLWLESGSASALLPTGQPACEGPPACRSNSQQTGARGRPGIRRGHASAIRPQPISQELELPGPGLAYMALPIMVADEEAGRNASSESSGVNEAGVALTATESIYNRSAFLAPDYLCCMKCC